MRWHSETIKCFDHHGRFVNWLGMSVCLQMKSCFSSWRVDELYSFLTANRLIGSCSLSSGCVPPKVDRLNLSGTAGWCVQSIIMLILNI